MIDVDFCVSEIIPILREIVKECDNMQYNIELKGQGNYVTTVDKMIEKKLIMRLQAILPKSGFVSEERGEELAIEYNWIIDPIDGTTNFIYGFPYTISVALSYKSIKNIILGVVYCPHNDKAYYGCKGKGSYITQNGYTRRLKVVADNQEGIAIFGLPYNRDKTGKIFDIAKTYYNVSSDLKRIGPSSLDICLVAEGKAKVYFELDLEIWDVAAGMLILSEAGGECKQKKDLFIFGSKKMIELLSD